MRGYPMSKEFNEALGNFITDFAGGGAVRHLASQGLTVSEITEQLDYPLPKAKVAKLVWQYYLDEGIVCLEEPKDYVEKVSFVKEQDAYGKISMRKVVDKIDRADAKYVLVDFGKRMYQDRETFIKSLDGLSEKDRDYVLDLPWPLQDVYHIENERILRILKIF